MFGKSVALRAAVLGTALGGCANHSTHARLARVERHAEKDDAEIELLSDRISDFERGVDEVLELYRHATADFDAAKRRLQRVQALGAEAAALYAEANEEYEAAARNWRLVTLSILAAATWDYAGHLCGTRMTTSQYRADLRKRGIELDGLDADHGLPRSRGGADHPLNYRMIDSSLNRSLGNDVLRKLLTHPTHLLQGAAISGLMRLRCSPQL
jgi:hypothetical protein